MKVREVISIPTDLWAAMVEVYDAAANLDLYEDFGEPQDQCANCQSLDPADFQAARRRVYDALQQARVMSSHRY